VRPSYFFPPFAASVCGPSVLTRNSLSDCPSTLIQPTPRRRCAPHHRCRQSSLPTTSCSSFPWFPLFCSNSGRCWLVSGSAFPQGVSYTTIFFFLLHKTLDCAFPVFVLSFGPVSLFPIFFSSFLVFSVVLAEVTAVRYLSPPNTVLSFVKNHFVSPLPPLRRPSHVRFLTAPWDLSLIPFSITGRFGVQTRSSFGRTLVARNRLAPS